MRPSTSDHPKMFDLADALNIPLPYAVGIMQLLWDWASGRCPAGDIGKYSDKRIAEAVHWPDSATLVPSLLAAHWIDPSDDHRLLLHDWHQHSSDAVDLRLSRTGVRYASGHFPRMTRLTSKERQDLCARWDWPLDELLDTGFLYAIQRSSDSAVKLGITTNVGRRFGQLSAQFGCTLTLLYSAVVLAYRHEESWAHRVFKANRIDGEWFTISPSTAVDYIKGIETGQVKS